MKDLDFWREEINRIDTDMAQLFVRRMQAAAGVAEYKKANNIPILNAQREAEVIQRGVQNLNRPDLEAFYTDFLSYTMALSRQYQQHLIGENCVAYQGTQGGFGQMVAQKLFPHGEMRQYPTFADVFNAVEQGVAAYGVVPFENSNTGDVSGVLDLCFSYPLFVVGMYDLPVHQNLLALPGAVLGDIKKVYSHEQALQQSKRFLQALNAELIPYENTATAAQFVARQGDPSLAAVASLEAGATNGLVPLARDISTAPDNATRFIVLSRKERPTGDRFSLLVSVENGVGQLARVIHTIAQYGFDMENIKSRPMPGRPWEYYFYIELVGRPDAETSRKLLQQLESFCLSVRTLGIYQRSTPQQDFAF